MISNIDSSPYTYHIHDCVCLRYKTLPSPSFLLYKIRLVMTASVSISKIGLTYSSYPISSRKMHMAVLELRSRNSQKCCE